ncbi:heme biosynthesis HemY N-terminal domain-containing protein [Orrella marina]|uniref:Protoheme IX synthesis protein n=1 Tax=Orrella marina TaxID=2163011 RepID=A0A2R4XGJ0_9BURK|nr:heme biosynthesis HemY N-terminal domain-containing protein [Orrella marina]AWB32884.1 protoheme IX synthesis protein [Orrella marina]
MRAWFWTILLVTLAVFLAVVIHSYPGNVLIVVGQWRVQVSLAFAALLTIGVFAAVYFLIRLFAWLVQVPERYRGWRTGRQEKFEQSQLELGWVALLEGRYAHAEKVLGRLADNSKERRRTVLAQLSAARAAHELGERTRRDELISRAQTGARSLAADKAMSVAVAVAAADLWLQDGQANRAIETLTASQADPQKHVHTMRLLLSAYQSLGQHDKVLEIARELLRKDALTAQQARSYVERSAAALLRQTQDKVQWQAVWKSLKAPERLYPEVSLAGAAGLQASGEEKEATRLLEQAIKESFDGRLLAAYARASSDQVNPRLQKAESWLTQRPDDPDLLTALGALCLASQMWGQAQRYLEQASRLRSDARVHALLGSLYDRIGKPQQAANHWRLATAVSAALPVLAQDVHLPAADIAADPKIHHVEGYVEPVDEDGDHGQDHPTGDSIASAQDFYPRASGSVASGSGGVMKSADHSGAAPSDRGEPAEQTRTQAAASQTVDEYHEFFDSAPIPYDGSPALATTRSELAEDATDKKK